LSGWMRGRCDRGFVLVGQGARGMMVRREHRKVIGIVEQDQGIVDKKTSHRVAWHCAPARVANLCRDALALVDGLERQKATILV
jgi:hypothetical protein